jgi:putative ABC transport system permease protein
VRFADLLRIALAALFQQKVRTFLTMAGVVIGTFALVVCLSLGRGFEQEVVRQLNRGSLSRQIMVWPGSGVREADIPPDRLRVSGPMSEAKRLRLKRAIIHRWPDRARGIQLNQRRVEALARLPHVESVVPLVQKYCQVSLNGSPPLTVIAFAANADNPHFRNRIVAGDYFYSDTGREVVVSEYLLYLWGITDDDAVDSVVGKKLRIEYRPGTQSPRALLALLRSRNLGLSPSQRQILEKTLKEMAKHTPGAALRRYKARIAAVLAAVPAGPLPVLAAMQVPPGPSGPPVFSEEFTIAGVLREFIEDRDLEDIFDLGAGARSTSADVFLPAQTAAELFSRGPEHAALGFPGVIMTVDREANVKAVTRQVRSVGLREYSLVEFVQGVRTNLVLVTFVTAFLAAVALLVAALGITNTMIMTVLERTREIGVMKAVGARDGHIRAIFLLEGALIGLLGGGLGVLLGWVSSLPGDALARSLLHDQSLPPFHGTLFVFPPWLTLGVPAFAAVVTTLAAFYPAWRATKVNPILALRHE